ncbi:aminotransferase-like domain-containing protein [Tropicibacter oceani]|uniref:PLP-dependent aminotransferase family protein n=1 Tax=Tropicibacter oceani TaxID=3058420 RepID=A0ABY8QDK6_9RHOB|nr:PLP-dependent aminotransferase family protein [Tropicibacter oceani]WGW02655.1 PLP-dependent aminotransferase family protein [Tropicibacter oceani]
MDTISRLYDLQTAGPKYRAVAEAIRGAIDGGSLGQGDKLPPVRDLAWTLKITPGTVARAYTILTDEGVLEASVGRGTFVAQRRRARSGVSWPANHTAQDTDQVRLFTPRIPDVGQVAMLHDAFARLAGRPPEDLLNYPSAQAFAPARQAVLRWLEGAVLGHVANEDIVLSHGGQSAISLVMQAVLEGPRPVVMVEELSYPGFRRAAELLRAEVVAVPMDGQGIVPTALEEIAQRHKAQLLCTSPEVHNPTGICTPEARREQIADVARRNGFHVLEDDCYRLGMARAPSYRALLPDQGWHVSSFSKCLTPSLRVGFAVAPQSRRADLRRTAEHGFFGLALPLAHLTQDILTRDETYGLMDKVREAFGAYVRIAVNTLGGYDLRWHEDVPFLWLTLPDGWRASTFVQTAEAEGVQLRNADEFALRDGQAPHAVRLAINAHVSHASFEAAMQRLRHLLDHPPERIAV